MSGDWDLLDGNPAPGVPGLIRILGKEIEQSATVAHEARIVLDGVSGDLAVCSWSGAAADEFRDEFSGLGPDLGAMAEAYLRVAGAVSTYADRLEQIQQSVEQALTRARLAKQRQELAGPKRDAAAKRVADLSRQLAMVKADESEKAATARLPSGDPGLDTQHQTAYQHAHDLRRSVEGALQGARADNVTFQREIDDAGVDLSAARQWAGQLRHDRAQAEKSAAATIGEALDSHLRNRSFWDQVTGWVGDQVEHAVDNITDFASAFVRGDWLRVVAELHKALTVLGNLVAIAQVLIVAVVFVAAVFAPPLALAMLPLAISALSGLRTASLVIAGMRLFTTAVLVGTKYRDPENGRQMAGWGDLGLATLDLALAGYDWKKAPMPNSALKEVAKEDSVLVRLKDARRELYARDSALAHFKRAIYADGRRATGFLRKIPIADPGAAASTADRVFHALKGFKKVGEMANEKLKRVQEFIEDERERHRSGAAVPAVGACYAN